ncbi:MAG: hypothetical protein GTO45_33825 [Candidatus Aminicenantes bacterium]|nr:hypothetical protein [Candidatus Aminicenantes bacterium]NIM83689.1 hypothetical protein [Candidatus Aminicenantes bacterium]NIN23114.1 hypothetical protein [Candidatus Aminicenantes bacterium]NIN46841.1 hypothetical protein [Candidatus Aminicenantes bacterium]NIN89763.1 hypothetical protein [Candidatus Aminicenantes bacterium]
MPHVVILPHAIEQKLKENERQEVINFINELIADTSNELKRDIIEVVEEKFERRLSEEIVSLKAELTEKMVLSEAKLTEKIAFSEAKLTEKISNNKAEIIKWMFIFWLGNVITIIGGVVGILKIAKVF